MKDFLSTKMSNALRVNLVVEYQRLLFRWRQKSTFVQQGLHLRSHCILLPQTCSKFRLLHYQQLYIYIDPLSNTLCEMLRHIAQEVLAADTLRFVHTDQCSSRKETGYP